MTITAQNIVLANEGKEVRLQAVLDVLNAHLREYYTQSFPSLEAAQLSIDEKVGNKYIRIWSGRGSHRSAYCFLDYQGNIYKPATWKAPAKHTRGSIFEDKCSWGKGLGPYGASYLR